MPRNGTHPFDAYYRRHSKAPTLRIDSGVQQIYVAFHRGYVHIKSTPPFAGEVYLTRTAFLTFLRKVTPFARLWKKHPADDWDVPARVHQQYLGELALGAEKRSRSRVAKRP